MIEIGMQMSFQIEIGIAITISISKQDRDRDRDLNFWDQGHTLYGKNNMVNYIGKTISVY